MRGGKVGEGGVSLYQVMDNRIFSALGPHGITEGSVESSCVAEIPVLKKTDFNVAGCIPEVPTLLLTPILSYK